ncbi:MAG: SurA N-terminal domain-containing protein [Chthoniobacterales bacterium]
MFNIFRKHQRVLMILVIVTIVSFGFFYDRYSPKGPIGTNDVGKMYNRTIRTGDMDRAHRYLQLAISLGMMDMLQGLMIHSSDEESMALEFFENLEIVRHEAKEFGIEPTNNQIMEGIKTLPTFQSNGQFDYEKYKKFVDPNQSNRLAPLGFSEKQIEDLVTDSLKLTRLRELISSQVFIGAAEVDQTLKIFQPVDVQVIRINLADSAKNITATDQDVMRIYEESKAQLKTEETRVVKYVKIDLPAGSSDLKNKSNLEALQKLSDAVTTFVEKARQGGLDEAAKASGYKVETTPEFNQAGKVLTGSAKTDLPLSDIAAEAFRLEAVASISDAIQAGNSFYVLALDKITPSRERTIEEVRPVIQEKIKNDSARKSMGITAQSSVEKIRQAMKEGKSFADAAKALGLPVQTITGVMPFSTSETPEKENSESQAFAASTIFLRDGEMSGFEKAPWGGFITLLSRRNPVDATLLSSRKPQIEKDLLRNKQAILFAEWFQSARNAADINVQQHRR